MGRGSLSWVSPQRVALIPAQGLWDLLELALGPSLSFAR